MSRRTAAASLLVLVAGCGAGEADGSAASPSAAREEPPAVRPRPAPRSARGVATGQQPTPPADDDPVARWIDVLQDPEAGDEARETAWTRLTALGAEALPRLVPLLDDPKLGCRAMWAIARMGAAAEPVLPRFVSMLRDERLNPSAQGALVANGRTAVPHLLAVAKDESPLVRRSVAIALGDIQTDHPGVGPALTALASDTDATVRGAALQSLGRGRVDPSVALPLLSAGLHDADPYVRDSALTSIGRLGERAAPCVDALCDLLGREGDEPAIRALGEIGPSAQRAVPRLLHLLGDGSSRTPEFEIVRALHAIDRDGLAVAMRIDEPGVRQAAAALQCIGPFEEEWRKVWRSALDDPDPSVRRCALGGAKGEPLTPEELAKVRASLAFPAAQVRQAAAWTLGGVASPSTELVEELAGRLRDEDPLVRKSAAAALGELRSSPEISVPALAGALADPEEVAIAAADAIGRFGPDARDAIPDLRRLLAGDRSRLRVHAAESLYAIEPGVESVATLTGFLRHENSEIRAEAVRFLGETERPDVIPELVKRLDDGQAEVRVAAARTLATFGPAAASATEALERMAASRHDNIASVAREALAAVRPR